MEKVSVSITEEQLARLNDRAEQDDTGRSAALRAILDEYADVRAECEAVREEYEAEVDELETEVDRLRRERRQVLEQRDERAELARYAEDQRSVEQRRREASLVERARWFVFGMSDESGEA
jgi:Ribbon-helix-helix protein, copG family.